MSLEHNIQFTKKALLLMAHEWLSPQKLTANTFLDEIFNYSIALTSIIALTSFNALTSFKSLITAGKPVTVQFISE